MYKQVSRLMAMVVIAAFSFYPVPMSQAAQTDSITVKVSIISAISVNVLEDALSLGSVAIGGTKVSSAGVTVTNDGSGVNETYSLSLTNPSGWTASSTAAGTEIYVLDAGFANSVSAIAWSEANHALSTSAVLCSATKFAGDQTGINVPKDAARKLWFQFKAPTATTVTSEQSIVVTVTAQAS